MQKLELEHSYTTVSVLQEAEENSMHKLFLLYFSYFYLLCCFLVYLLSRTIVYTLYSIQLPCFKMYSFPS